MTVGELRAPLADASLLRDELFIGGTWVAGEAVTLTVADPFSGATIAEIAGATAGQVNDAVAAASAALDGWAALTATGRARILRDWYDLIVAHADDLATILTLEQGKPLAEARAEILYGASFVEWFAEEGKRLYGDVIPSNVAGRRLFAIRQPIGVVAAITPWNFPSAMILRKASAALGAGCTFVCKPAEETPLSALALAELATRAGLPAGVFNVVVGEPPVIGGVLTASGDVRALSFTGSTAVGKLLMAQCAGTVKRVTLELGGNAPVLVFDDADPDSAAEKVIAAKFRNGGQTCVCANRILVQAGVYDDFIAAFSRRIRALHAGDGLADGVTQGPLISSDALEKVQRHVQDAVAHGARLTVGGSRVGEDGTCFEPTLVENVTTDMLVSVEETFGPVAAVMRFSSEDEAVAIANATPYGLAAYVFSGDVGRAWTVAEKLEVGVVAINTGAFSYEGAPFGGVKESGLGREGSRHGLDEFTELKYLAIER